MSERSTQTPIALDSRFKLFSTTKSLTAIAVMALIDRGKLAVTDSMGGYIPATGRNAYRSGVVVRQAEAKLYLQCDGGNNG